MTDIEGVTVAEIVDASKHLGPEEMQTWLAGVSLDETTDRDEAGEELASWSKFRTEQADEMELGGTQLRKEAASLEVARRILGGETDDRLGLLPATVDIGKPCTGKGRTPGRQSYYDFRGRIEAALGVSSVLAGRIATALSNIDNLDESYFQVEIQDDGSRMLHFSGTSETLPRPDELFHRPRMLGQELYESLLNFLQIVGEQQATSTD
ncbi:hypothetical protein KDA23_01180 [Candidatus Saccharibacteria bacterium]|nr:hypothetical protein [Candidatus Saccharibacteria bacterium]